MLSKRCFTTRTGRHLPRPSSLISRLPCAARYQSNVAKNPRIDLENTLVEIHRRAPALISRSRLQLAVQGLRQPPGREEVRVAVLGLGGVAARVVKALLADPLVEEQPWERELDEHDGRPVIVRLGGGGGGGDGRLEVSGKKEMSVFSPGWDPNLEMLVMDIDSFETPGYVNQTHQTLMVAEGLAGAVKLSLLRDDDGLVLKAVDMTGLSGTALDAGDLVVIDAGLAEHGIRFFRRGPQHAMEYEQRWSASNLAALAGWLKATTTTTEEDATKPALRRLISAMLRSAVSGIEGDNTHSDAETDLSRARLKEWAERAHAELQEQLDVAFTESRWRKLGWWKLFWRADDVGMLANELLAQRFLPTAEQELIYLAGQVGTRQEYAQPKQRDSEAHNKWPGHIAFTRRYLRDETVPALQSLAQRLVAQALATSSTTGALAGLLYVSSASAGVFEAGAVAALGAAYSLARMQRKWDAARAFWEGETREEGRKAVRAAERSVADALSSQKTVEDIQETRALIAKAEKELADMK